jgi:hypothetical protein
MSEEQKLKETTKVALAQSELEKIMPPKTGALIAEGTMLKIFPGAKDIPADNEARSMEVIARPLKITRSDEDINVGYAYLRRLELMKQMLEGTDDYNALRKRAKERREKVGEVFRENMANMFDHQRNLEKTYREIDTFFYEAALNRARKLIIFLSSMPTRTSILARLPTLTQALPLCCLTGRILI